MVDIVRKQLQLTASSLVLSASLLGLFPAGGAETPSKLETDPQGWEYILPGADLKGWYRVPVPPTGQLGRQQWHVDTEKKLLICDGDGGGICRFNASGQWPAEMLVPNISTYT